MDAGVLEGIGRLRIVVKEGVLLSGLEDDAPDDASSFEAEEGYAEKEEDDPVDDWSEEKVAVAVGDGEGAEEDSKTPKIEQTWNEGQGHVPRNQAASQKNQKAGESRGREDVRDDWLRPPYLNLVDLVILGSPKDLQQATAATLL